MLETIPISKVSTSQYKNFSCGSTALEEYLKRYAKTNHKKGIGKTFTLLKEQSVIGYYTISMAEMEFSSVPLFLQRGLPKYPIPVARLGRLAVALDVKGKGFGKFLLVDAIHRIQEASEIVAAHAVIVDAKDQQASAFYQRFGFSSFIDKPRSLFLPLASLSQFFSKDVNQ